jgi:diamine N-acetyltransferase
MKWERVRSSEQIQAVAALAQEIWTRHYTPLIGPEQVEYMLEKFQSVEAITRQMETEGFEYILVPDSGYAAWVPDLEKKSLFLSKIYVKADRRGLGLGRTLLELAEQRARALGCTELCLTVNRHNADTIAFYERMGLHKTNELVQDIGHGYVMDDWRMAKPINSVS